MVHFLIECLMKGKAAKTCKGLRRFNGGDYCNKKESLIEMLAVIQ